MAKIKCSVCSYHAEHTPATPMPWNSEFGDKCHQSQRNSAVGDKCHGIQCSSEFDDQSALAANVTKVNGMQHLVTFTEFSECMNLVTNDAILNGILSLVPNFTKL